MEKNWNDFMKVGVIHFMAYPQTMKGEGQILETLKKICDDGFFTAVEISWIKDDKTRESVKQLLKSSGLAVAYGAQPRLLVNKFNLSALDKVERQKAIDEVKRGIDEASYLGAVGVAVLSGADPGEADRDKAKKLLVDSLKYLSKYAKKKKLNFELESFDRDIDKKSLIGPSKEAVEIAKEVRKECDNFGLVLDLSHFPIQFETTKDALTNAADYLTHMHMGNCVFKDKNHPAYGDQHPRFGIEGGENGVEELREFLKVLFDIGFFSKGTKPIVSFEVKPLSNETSESVIENAKQTFKEAWAKL
ncbi:MAG: sugar phosphate isomerase/epimerase [Elusimicrobia bacterium]|nr:sugar phosphate isomerase/epimerase [Elusimicrobiota bacterium]